jgi:hypothetical protein
LSRMLIKGEIAPKDSVVMKVEAGKLVFEKR